MLDQQLSCWLLLSLNRLPDNRLTIIQELVANMMDVRHAGGADAARKLQKLGAIESERIICLNHPRGIGH